MSFIAIFFIAIFVAFTTAIPPGLLNMTTAKISMKEGKTRGITFALGSALVFSLQTLIAILLARFLSKRPDVINVLKQVALVVFVLLSIYYLLLAKKTKKVVTDNFETKSKQSRFFYGMFLSSINLYPIPFQSYMAVTLASFGWLTFDKLHTTSYVVGAAIGSFVNLYMYIFFFDKINSKRETSSKTMNYIIGTITGIIAIVTFISLILKE